MDDNIDDADDFIKISEEENSEFMEFPKEENNTLMLSTLQAQFPNAIGLKYRGPSGAWRALRAVENVMEAPKGGWGDRVYVLTVSAEAESNKRKTVEGMDSEIKKTRLNPYLQDMAVLNLPYSVTTAELKEYFEKNFGELEYCEVKTYRDTGKSRGYGFIRFKEQSCATQAIDREHHMDGRKVDLRLKEQKPLKLFIGRCAVGTTEDDLREHFSQFGELSDVYIPTPFRNYAFITYQSQAEGNAALHGEREHIVKGSRLNVQERNEDNRPGKGKSAQSENINNMNNQQQQQFGNYNMYSQGAPLNPNMDPTLKTMLLHYLQTQ